jgi:gliding motility-associated-like protein
MRFSTGDCGTEFIPATTGEVLFPDTPEWQNITSMVWEHLDGDLDASIDLFRFIPSAIEQTGGLESGCFFPVGVTPVTYTATDENGTVTSCTFNVTVRDVEKPVIITKELTAQLDASQLAEITIADITASVPTDNCGIDSTVISQTVFTCSDIGDHEITITVTDVNGNVSTATVMVTITGSTSNSAIVSIADVAVCESYVLPEITGTSLSGSERYYSEPNGKGFAFEEGETLEFSDFPSYPARLYAFDSESTEECKPQATFQLSIETTSQLSRPPDVMTCENYVFPQIMGKKLSGNEAYYTQHNGKGIKYKEGDQISRNQTKMYPITIYIYDETSITSCNEEASFELDLTVCELQVSIAASQTEICDNEFTTIALTAVTNPEVALGNFSYAWRKNGDPSIVSTSKTFNTIPAFNTVYDVTVVDDGAQASVNTSKASIEIVVNEAPVTSAPFIVDICDTTADGAGSEQIDLTTYDMEVSLDADNVTVTYHASQEIADAGSPSLTPSYEISTEETTLFARVTNQNTGCFETTSITFKLNDAPSVVLQESYALCRTNESNPLPTTTIETGLDSTAYDFEWSVENESGAQSLPSDQGFITVSEVGTYMVVATDRSTGCSTTASTVVNSAIVPVEFTATADVSAILDAHRIETNLIPAAGDDSRFQVRLDDGIWYDMNTSSSGFFYNFDNVETGNGIHQVYFRDAVGCFSDQREVLLIGVPQFFTPNDDGYNDRWNVFGATGLLEDSRLFIFDRYGKLLLQLQTSTSGWDGTFNGEPLPSTDYWFTLELNGGQIVKGHFAMKR